MGCTGQKTHAIGCACLLSSTTNACAWSEFRLSLLSLLSAGWVDWLKGGVAAIGWVEHGSKDDVNMVRFSFCAEGPEMLLALTGTAACVFLTLLQASGSPFCSTHSVGWHLQDPMTMLGSDMSGMASNLSSSMVKRNRRKGLTRRRDGWAQCWWAQGYIHWWAYVLFLSLLELIPLLDPDLLHLWLV